MVSLSHKIKYSNENKKLLLSAIRYMNLIDIMLNKRRQTQNAI